jgi:hypothetical protein
LDGVEGAAADAGAGEVAAGLQVGHDALDGAFGDADPVGDVTDPAVGLAGDGG